MKRIAILWFLTLAFGVSQTFAQDSLKTEPYKDIFGGPVISWRMGMLLGGTTERVRMSGIESNIDGLRLGETSFFQTDFGIIFGLEFSVLVGSKLGARFQPTFSLMEATYFLVDPAGTQNPFRIPRSSVELPLQIQYGPFGCDHGIYGIAGGRWRLEAANRVRALPFDLSRSNWCADLGLGFALKTQRGSVALEVTYSHGLKDQFPTSRNVPAGEENGVFHDRMLFALVFR